MAIKGLYTRLLVGTDGAGWAWDFSTQSNKLETSLTSQAVEDTTFQASARTYIVLQPQGEITQQGYVTDIDAGYMEEALTDAIANAKRLYVAALYGTATAACAAYVSQQTDPAAMKISAPVDGLITFNGSWGAGAGITRGKRMATVTELDATGAQTSIDLGAAGSAGGWAWLWVTAIDGTATNAAFKVQSSATEGDTYADEGTFTLSDVGCYRVTMTGTVNRWVRLNCTDLGGATSISATAVVAVSGVTY